MNAGAIAQNHHIDAAIVRCFEYLPAAMARKFERKFKDQRSDNDLVMHTFRELLVGAYLANQGEKLEYEMGLGAKTPDWTLVDGNGRPIAILELTNFHAPRAEETAMRESQNRSEIYCDWQPDPTRRLYQAIQVKVDSYSQLVRDLGVAYVVAVYGDFLAAVEIDELREVLYEAHDGGIFRYSQAIAGVLFFEERSGTYGFQYLSNPAATAPFFIKDGRLLEDPR